MEIFFSNETPYIFITGTRLKTVKVCEIWRSATWRHVCLWAATDVSEDLNIYGTPKISPECSNFEARPVKIRVCSCQCLTDYSRCAAGSRSKKNHDTEEHLEASTTTVCAAERLNTVYIKCWYLHWVTWTCYDIVTITYRSTWGASCDSLRYFCSLPLTYFPCPHYHFNHSTSHMFSVYNFSS